MVLFFFSADVMNTSRVPNAAAADAADAAAKLLSAWQRRRLGRVMAPYRCLRRGYQQRVGTCWFNAVLNGLLMGEWMGALLLRMLQGLTAAERQQVEFIKDVGVDRCPALPTRLHILAHAAAYLQPGHDRVPRGLLPAPRRFYADSPEAETGNMIGSRAVNLIRRVYDPQLSHAALEDGGHRRGVPVAGASKLLPILQHLFAPADVLVIGRAAMLPYAMRRLAAVHTRPKLLVFEYAYNPVALSSRRAYSLPVAMGAYQLNDAHLTLITQPATSAHSVAAFRCRGQDHIYDSNKRRAVRCRWSDGDLADLEAAYPQYKYANVSYACYVNTALPVLPVPPPRQPVTRSSSETLRTLPRSRASGGGGIHKTQRLR